MTTIALVLIGLAAGILSGMFGIGGGVLIVPALVYVLGFSQQMATGTSLAVLLPPVGIAAVYEYHKNGNVDIRAAAVIALMLIAGGWLGAQLTNQLDTKTLKVVFGLFLILVGGYMVFDVIRG